MSLLDALEQRCEGNCEMCGSSEELHAFIVAPKVGERVEEQVALCSVCTGQVTDLESIVPDHWRCLNDSMWSQEPAVQVLAYRMLHHLSMTDWAADLIPMMYLADETMEWAQQGIAQPGDAVHKDANGIVLKAGDSVVLIKDLHVKGTSMIAKRGTAVRRISLVQDNHEHIEGKVNDQRIVIITKFVKKT